MQPENEYAIPAGHRELEFVFKTPDDFESGVIRAIDKWINPDGSAEIRREVVFDPPWHPIPFTGAPDEIRVPLFPSVDVVMINESKSVGG